MKANLHSYDGRTNIYLRMVEIPFLAILVMFLASTIFCTFGFGDAMLALPFLSMIIGVKMSTPLLALSGLTLSILLMTGSFKSIKIKELWKLVVGSFLGVPIGVYILKTGNEQNIRIALGILIMLIALYNLLRPSLTTLRSEYPAFFFGFAGGIMGGAFNTSAPPAVVYGTMRKWGPTTFVGMMQGYFIPTDIFVIVGHLRSGLLNKNVFHLYLWCLPFLLLAIWVGSIMKKKIPTEKFYKGVFLLILVSGLLLFIRSLWS